MFELGHAADRAAPRLDDPVADAQPRAPGRGVGPAGGHDRRCGERSPRVIADSDDAGGERLPGLESGKDTENVLQRHREADSGVIELRSRHHPRRLGRQRGQHPDHPSFDVDQRAAVVRRRYRRIGLDGAPPGPVRRREDPDADARVSSAPGAPEDERPLADRQRLSRHRLHHRQRGRPCGEIDLEQHQSPGEIAAGHPGDEPVPTGQGDDRLGRILGNGKRCRHDPAVGTDHKPARGPRGRGSLGRPAKASLGDARHLDPDHRWSDRGGGGLESLLLLEPHAFGPAGPRSPN